MDVNEPVCDDDPQEPAAPDSDLEEQVLEDEEIMEIAGSGFAIGDALKWSTGKK